MLYLYVKQDGMYVSQKIVITDELNESLPSDWYVFETNNSLAYTVSIAYAGFMNDVNDTDKIHVNLEDEYILTEEDIRKLAPRMFI